MGDKFTIEVEGLKELEKKFKDLDKEGRKRVARAINVGALEYHRAVAKSIRKRTGKYRKYKRGGKTHWSSSPRRAPNSDRSNLVKNLKITMRASSGRLGAEVISGAKYSAALEFGHRVSRRGGRRTSFVTAPKVSQGLSMVAPRPFMFPMLRKMNRQLVARISQAINGVIDPTRSRPSNSKMNSRITSGKSLRVKK